MRKDFMALVELMQNMLENHPGQWVFNMGEKTCLVTVHLPGEDIEIRWAQK